MLQDIQAPPQFLQPSDDSASIGRLAARLAAAKRPFACRRVDFMRASGLTAHFQPESGDLVLARIVELGLHAKLESPAGRRVQLYEGDEVVLAYGARYAPDQFEANIPHDAAACHMVAAGGIAAQVVSRHSGIRKPTSITPIGVLLGADGRKLNLNQFSLPPAPANRVTRTVIGVVGTSMNSGKTTAAANLIRGLINGGVRVGACKVTGTGSGGDLWSMMDAGASRALDFTDAGFATTAGAEFTALERAANDLISHLEAEDVDIVVVEIADGLLQRETAALLRSSFAARLDAIILAASDAMGALAGYGWLQAHNLPARAITGIVTASPLATQEVRQSVDIEVVGTASLANRLTASRLSHGLTRSPTFGVAT